MTKRVDMAGRRIGRWLVLSYTSNRKWLCRCDCGLEKEVDGGSLRAGRSAGCIKCHTAEGTRETHGQKRTRLYSIWSGMIARCENSNEPAYMRYGGRGIVICAHWRATFEAFRDWALANGYADHLTLDRENNDGNYEPANCRWSTYTEQNRNRCNNRPIRYLGGTILIPELAERCDLPADVLKNRIRRYGWPIERAISTPVRKRRSKP